MSSTMISILSLLAASLLIQASAQSVTFQILHHNDGESELSNVDNFAALITTLRQDAANNGWGSIMLSAGDNYLPGPEFSLSEANDFNPFLDAILYDNIGYDAIAIGNHEFDSGPDVFQAFVESFPMTMPPFVSANLDYSAEPGLAALEAANRLVPSTMIEVMGRKVGIVGLTTPNLQSISSPRDVGVLLNVAQVAQAQIDDLLSMNVTIIILISHLQGLDEDIAVIGELTGVDIVVAGGGDELLTNMPANFPAADGFGSPIGGYPFVSQDADGLDVLFVTTPGQYRVLGQLVVTFDVDGNLESVDTISDNIPVTDAAGSDAFIFSSIVEPVQEGLAELDSEIVATTEIDLDSRTDIIRSVESAIGNVIADSFLSISQALSEEFGAKAPQVAIANGGGIRNDEIIPSGSTISALKTFEILPFTNFISVIEDISSENFKLLLENAYSRTVFEGGQIIRQGSGTGRFAQIAGFMVTYNIEGTPLSLSPDGTVLTPGNRILDVKLMDGTQIVSNGVPVPGVSVTLALVDFLARGGDQYFFFDKDPNVGLEDGEFTILGVTYQFALRDYLETVLGGLITAAQYPEEGSGRINVVFSAAITSDPHLKGFRGQELDFTGSPGSTYCLVKDSSLDLVLNAKFAQAWTTGISLDPVQMKAQLMHTKGTWISEVGLSIGSELTIEMSVNKADEQKTECPVDSDSKDANKLRPQCWKGGKVQVNGRTLVHVGKAENTQSTQVSLKNSKSFSRVSIISSAPIVEIDIDHVPPPASWQVDSSDTEMYSHLNLHIHKITLTSGAKGVLGETQNLKHDEQGKPIMTSDGADGQGILNGSAEDYAVSSLLAKDSRM